MTVPSMAVGTGNPAVIACYGREAVEDLEMRVAAGPGGYLDRQIETLGLDFQIATRLTSWVAVIEEATVDPGQPMRRERIPQALPAGLSVAGLGLRAPAFSVSRCGWARARRIFETQRRSTWGFDLDAALEAPERRRGVTICGAESYSGSIASSWSRSRWTSSWPGSPTSRARSGTTAPSAAPRSTRPGRPSPGR